MLKSSMDVCARKMYLTLAIGTKLFSNMNKIVLTN